MAVLLLGATPDLDLQLVVARPDPVPRRPRRGVGRHRGGRRVPRPGARGPRPTSPALRHVVADRARRRRRGRVVGRPARRRARRSRGRGRDRAAARPRHDHLHVGHDRSAQGRDARSPQHLLDGRQPPRAALGFAPDRSRIVSYLPMAHIAERVTTHYGGIAFAYEVTTCADIRLLGATLAETQAADPLRCAAHVREDPQHGAGRARRRPGPGRGVRAGARGRRAVSPSTARAARRCRSSSPPSTSGSTPSRCVRRDSCSGSTSCGSRSPPPRPIPVEVLQFFRSAGVPLSELYGLSESTGPMTWDPVRVKPGTVGRAIPGMEVRLADDGEVLGRGGNIFRGLPRRSRAHRRGARRRRLAAHRRHRRSSTTRATCASSTARRSSSSPRAARTCHPPTSRPR